jgi:diguanylate cyclase (GGDEF)-like protein/PAS domain S-box-containing protein
MTIGGSMTESPPDREDATEVVVEDVVAICIRNVLDTPGTIAYFKDRQGRFITVSIDCARLYGRTQEEMVGLTDFDLTDHTHALELLADEQRIMETGEPLIDKEEVDRLVNQAGTWVETSKFPLRAIDGTIIGTFGYSRDVSRWELAEQKLSQMAAEVADSHAQLAQAEAQLRAVLNGSSDAIALYDRDLRYRYINPAGERLKGKTFSEVIGRTDRETGTPHAWLDELEAALTDVLDTGRPRELEFPELEAPLSAASWFHLSLSPDLDATGAVVGVMGSIRDITHIKRAERSQAYRALHDPLTGLANRTLLMDRLGKALAQLERSPGRIGLLFIDLDHFKQVNDTHGHAVGDRILLDVARRLKAVARRGDTVARLGGDEFVLLCDNVEPGRIEAIAERLLHSLSEPFDDVGPSSASIGTATTEDPQSSASGLLHAADSAMYRAKTNGRNRFEVSPPLTG